MPSAPRQTLSNPIRLLPIVAEAFAELGYRRATTAELARRCGVRQNILYRAWPDKKAMFIASIDHVFGTSLEAWQRVLATLPDTRQAASALLEYEAIHHGEFGRYRIIFVALSETEDPDIRTALRQMYQRFQQFIAAQVGMAPRPDDRPDADFVAWALVGLGTVANITRQLQLLDDTQRGQMFQQAGQLLLAGKVP